MCIRDRLGTLFLDPLMRVLGATPTILPYARDYARYILFGAPITVSYTHLDVYKRQPHQRVQHAHQDLYQSLAAQLQEEDLKHHEKREDGRQRCV